MHNDATNVWSQIYTMGQLASTADKATGKTTRYNNSKAVDSAVAYEKAIKGNMLYVASKIDSGTAKKKVAYLYAIDEDNKTAYFFTPVASGLLSASNTGKSATSCTDKLTDTPISDYAANNATVSLGYMDVLPFITDTFDNGVKVNGKIKPTKDGAYVQKGGSDITADGIEMRVEDIYTMSPACKVDYSTASGQLKGIDVIIFNTNTALTSEGTSNGQNLSGILNTGAYATGLTPANVKAWAESLGFTGKLIGGDDFGTSSKQPVPGTADAIEGGTAPMLYCQRNYTADRDSRAAWAIAQVYPELYNNNADATYGYWVKNVYHIKADLVDKVVQFMENDSTASKYDESVVEKAIAEGYNWWVNTGSKSATWKDYAYYNGSTRASFYDGVAASEEPADTVGIFAPSALWTAAAPAPTPEVKPQPQAQTQAQAQTVTVKAKTFTMKAKKLKKKAQTIKAAKVTKGNSAQTAITYSLVKANKSKGKFKVAADGKITVKKGLKKGTYKLTLKASAAETTEYQAASKNFKVTIKVK